MKELVKHLPAIKAFMEERTQALQEISEQMLKNFLREAYKLPFLFPVRIIVNEDKFVNFLFDIRKEILEGKKIEITPLQEVVANTPPSTIEIEDKKESIPTQELKPTSKAKTTTTKKSTKKITDTTQELNAENTNTKTNKTTKAKKTPLTDKL